MTPSPADLTATPPGPGVPLRTRARLLPELALVVAAGWGLYAVLKAFKGTGSVLSYTTLLDRAPHNAFYRFLWMLADTNEAQFYASVFGGVALLGGAYLAYRLGRSGSAWQGFPIVAGTGLWPWVLVASLLGLLISVAIYGFILASGEWIPTFVPFVSIPAGVVLVYGGSWRNVLTGGILGGLIGFPIAYGVIKVVLDPIKFPAVIGNVTGMWLGGIIVFELCHRVLPWMRRPRNPRSTEGDGGPQDRPHGTRDEGDRDEPGEEWSGTQGETPRGRAGVREGATAQLPEKTPAAMDRPGWLARRTLADFTEAQFYGNEIASAAVVGGVILSWLLNSGESVYGTGLLPALLVSQIMASSLGIALYRDRWRDLEWYPTFVPVVSVAPAVILTYGGGVPEILSGAILGALIGPPIAQFLIERIPNHWHPYVANTFAMAVCTTGVIAVLLPLPGFTLPS